MCYLAQTPKRPPSSAVFQGQGEGGQDDDLTRGEGHGQGHPSLRSQGPALRHL